MSASRLTENVVLGLGFTVTTVHASVAVAGATGGVGQLLVRRLCSSGVPVRALVRDAGRARAVLPAAAALAETGSLCSEGAAARARSALKGVHALYVCIGTTAFPTRRWLRGDTPQSVDVLGVRNLLEGTDLAAIRRVVLLSSIGTARVQKMPFLVVNAFGVLDAKREAEQLVRDAAIARRFSYAIIRPGRLVGAPHTNIGMLPLKHEERMGDVELLVGDSGAGNCSRRVAADVMMAAGLAQWDLDFTVIQKEGQAAGAEELRRRVRGMRTSEEMLA